MPNFTRQNVLRWMQSNFERHLIDESGDLNMTTLAEYAAAEWDETGVPGPLDDDTHWIWDCALAVKEDIVDTEREAAEKTTASRRYRERVVVSRLSVDRMNDLSRGYTTLIHNVRAYMWVQYPTWELKKEVKYKVEDIVIISENGDDIEIGLI